MNLKNMGATILSLMLLVGASAVQASPSKRSKSASSGSVPAPIAQMMKQGNGVRFQDKFDAPGGLTGYVLSAANGERRIYYVTPDGNYAILGIMVDARLNSVTAQHQKTYMNVLEFIDGPNPGAKSDQGSPLDRATRHRGAFTEGMGPAELFLVFDGSCSACAQVYRETRPYLNRIQIHWLPVAINNDESSQWLEAFVASADKAGVLAAMFSDKTAPRSTKTAEGGRVQEESLAILKAAGGMTLPLALYLDDRNAEQAVHGLISRRRLDGLARISDVLREPRPDANAGKRQ